jgi:hypothetical protein
MLFIYFLNIFPHNQNGFESESRLSLSVKLGTGELINLHQGVESNVEDDVLVKRCCQETVCFDNTFDKNCRRRCS